MSSQHDEFQAQRRAFLLKYGPQLRRLFEDGLLWEALQSLVAYEVERLKFDAMSAVLANEPHRAVVMAAAADGKAGVLVLDIPGTVKAYLALGNPNESGK